MRRILYLSRGGCVGGSQRQLYYVVSNLNHGYEPVVVCPKDGPFVSALRVLGVSTSVLPLRPWRKFPHALLRYVDAERLARFAAGRGVAVVHSSDLWLSGYLNWVSLRLNIPSVLHVRTPVSAEEVRKHRCNRATRLVAISQRVRRNLIDAGVSGEKISQIDDSVDLQRFRADGKAANVLRRDFGADGSVLIGLVGLIKPSKRQLEFLEAAAKLKRDSKRQVVFFLIGQIYSRDYFNRLTRFVAASGLERDIVFTGRREDMPEVLRALDIVVSLSGGSVMFEAMACGRCVVSAGFSSRADSVHLQDGRTGVLVESRDPGELARALLVLTEHRDVRDRIGREAMEWARENLCRDRMTVQTVRVYDELIDSRS